MWEFLPLTMQVAGNLMAAFGARSAGNAAMVTAGQRQTLDEFQAQQLEQNAGQVVAAGQRQAAEQTRQTTFAQSRALALAAASGGGASDPGVINLISNIAAEGSYRASTALYNAEDQARALRMKAQAERYSGAMEIAAGQNKQTAYDISATGSLLSAGSSLFKQYAKTSGPQPGVDYSSFNGVPGIGG